MSSESNTGAFENAQSSKMMKTTATTLANTVPLSKGTESRRFDDLPNECLQLILDYLPFEDLLNNAPLVSSKWYEVTKLVCNRKTSLNLYGDPDSLIPETLAKIFCKYIGLALESDSLTSFHCKYSIRRESQQNRDLLKSKFPNITSLNVIQFRLTPDMDALFELLKMWTELTAFRLIVYRVKDEIEKIHWDKICRKINKMVNLRDLALFCRCPVSEFDTSPLTGLGRVCQMNIGGFPVNLLQLTDVTKLSLYHLDGEEWKSQLDKMPVPVASKITDLTIYPANEQLQLPYLDIISRKFLSIRYLHIRTRLPLVEVLPPLSNLPELNHLRLWHYLDRSDTNGARPLSAIDAEEISMVPQLPQVTMLHLYIRLSSHTQLNWIPIIFPRLKWLKFDRFRSGDCAECPAGVEQASKAKCEKALLSPLKKCTELKRIYLDRKSLQIENCPLEYFTVYDELSPGDF